MIERENRWAAARHWGGAGGRWDRGKGVWWWKGNRRDFAVMELCGAHRNLHCITSYNYMWLSNDLSKNSNLKKKTKPTRNNTMWKTLLNIITAFTPQIQMWLCCTIRKVTITSAISPDQQDTGSSETWSRVSVPPAPSYPRRGRCLFTQDSTGLPATSSSNSHSPGRSGRRSHTLEAKQDTHTQAKACVFSLLGLL